MDDVHSCDEMLQLFVGQDLHTTHTEAFSPETTYQHEAFDNDGKLLHSKFPSYTYSDNKGTTWECSTDLFKLSPATEVTEKLQQVYEHRFNYS